MKKNYLFMMVIVLAFSLAACGSNSSEETETALKEGFTAPLVSAISNGEAEESIFPVNVSPYSIWLLGSDGSETSDSVLTHWLTNYLTCFKGLPQNHEQAFEDYRITSVQTTDTKDGMKWILGRVIFDIKTYDDPAGSLWISGNGDVGTGEKAGWVVDKYQEIVLYRDIDNTWHCKGFGTGGYQLDEFSSKEE